MKLPYFLLLATLLGFRPDSSHAQTYFNQRYPLEPQGYVGATAIMPTDTGYVTVGFGTAASPYLGHVMVAFFDHSGQVRHHRLFSHSVAPDLYACQSGPLTPLPDGGFSMAGSLAINSQFALAQLWRFTATGDTLWTRTFGTLGTDPVFTQHCYVPADSGFAMVGNIKQSSTQSDLLLLRTDQQGRERWRRTFRVPGQGFHYGHQIKATTDGGFLLVGYSAINSGSGGPYNTALLVVKTDATGQEQWRYTLDTPFRDEARTAVALPDGSVLIGGTLGTGWLQAIFGVGRMLLLRLDAQGQEIWKRAYGPARYSTALLAANLLPDGSAVFGGDLTDSVKANGSRGAVIGFVLKVCAATGDSIWYRHYRFLRGASSDNYLYDLTSTPDGGFVGAGFLHAFPPDAGPQSIWLFKTDSAGYLQPGGAPPPAVACPLLAVTPDIEKPRVALYPNPTLPDGRFSLEAPAGATLVLTDALGREVWRTSHLSPLTSNLKLPRPGLYLLRLTWPDGRTVQRKVVR